MSKNNITDAAIRAARAKVRVEIPEDMSVGMKVSLETNCEIAKLRKHKFLSVFYFRNLFEFPNKFIVNKLPWLIVSLMFMLHLHVSRMCFAALHSCFAGCCLVIGASATSRISLLGGWLLSLARAAMFALKLVSCVLFSSKITSSQLIYDYIPFSSES